MYRKVKVESVRETDPPGDTLLIDFEQSAMSVELRKDWLCARGLRDIHSGQQIKILGTEGNKDVDLWGLGAIAEMLRADPPERQQLAFDIAESRGRHLLPFKPIRE